MIIIFHGTDRLTIDERVLRLRAERDPSAISTTVIDDAASDIPAVQAAAGAIGFFGSGRVVVARDLLMRTAGRGRKSKKETDTGSALSMLAGVPRETILLIVEQSLDPGVEKQVRRAVPEVQVERCEVPRGQRLVEWACARARQYDAVLGQTEARSLLEALFPGNWAAMAQRDDVPPDLYRLDTEVAKLATAAGAEGTITSEHVTSLIPGADAVDLWGITNAIMAGDAARAAIELERAFRQGSAAEGVLGQIVGQFEALAAAATASRSVDLAEVARVSSLTEGRLRQSARYLALYPPERVAATLDSLRDLDAAAKQGMVDLTDALVPLIVRIAGGTTLSTRAPQRR